MITKSKSKMFSLLQILFANFKKKFVKFSSQISKKKVRQILIHKINKLQNLCEIDERIRIFLHKNHKTYFQNYREIDDENKSNFSSASKVMTKTNFLLFKLITKKQNFVFFS